MQSVSAEMRSLGKTMTLVPTMGAFHNGHISLMEHARKLSDFVVVSIFVNPLQFGPDEDFKVYPRRMEEDRALAENAGCDILFCPAVEEMYPAGFQTRVFVEQVTKPLCGSNRPGHFQGVTTVVTKLFNTVRPHKAVFGLKDYQQWLAIGRIVYDLNMDVELIGHPIVREPDGLAMSSRNFYLSAGDRKAAGAIYKALSSAQDMTAQGERSVMSIKRSVSDILSAYSQMQIDYISLCHPETLDEIKELREKTLLAVAVRIGKTRLIDNCLLLPGKCE